MAGVILGCGSFGGIGSAPDLFGHGENEEEALAIMDAAWEHELTAFDTADAYGGGASETMIGKWIASRGRRPSITTKTFNPMSAGADHGLGRERMMCQIESSLERLGVDHVDVYLAHTFDPDTPVHETAATFESLVDTGLIGAWGLSNVDGDQLRAFLDVGRPKVVQNSYSLLDRADEADVLPLCEQLGIDYTPFSPLAGGWLTGKYRRDLPVPAGSRMALRPGPYEDFRTERTFDALERLAGIASERGTDMATLSIAWLLSRPPVTAVVVGPRRPQHLEPAVRALDLQLSEAEADELAALFG
jgi:aryl-alcohol dehydrogenase-like predicted oxidoreductase